LFLYEKNKQGITTLHSAVDWRDLEMAKIFVQKGTSVNEIDNLG